MMKRFALFLMGALMCLTTALAQDKKKLDVELSADFVTSYLWRGGDMSGAAIQPSLALDYQGLGLELWSSIELMGSKRYKEIELILSYSVGKFEFCLEDIWCGKGNYFDYKSNSTNHLFELNVEYDFGPVVVEWNTFFAGDDARTKSGKRAYSSYFEANMPFKLGGFDWKATLGVVPYSTPLYRVKGFGVTNLGLQVGKDIKITNSFSLPIFIDLMTNPYAKDAFLAVGFTLKP